jgi:hypothetical protein
MQSLTYTVAHTATSAILIDGCPFTVFLSFALMGPRDRFHNSAILDISTQVDQCYPVCVDPYSVQSLLQMD